MNGHLAAVIVTGFGLGIGLWLILVRVPLMRRTTLTQRVEPQLRGVDNRSKLLKESEDSVLFGPLERLFRLFLSDAVGRLGRFNISVNGLEVRLQQAGRRESALEFRAIQLLWSGIGMLAGLVVSLGLIWSGRANAMGGFALTLAMALGGYLAFDHLLGVAIKRRQERVLSEFPAIAELLALAVGAGESAASALARVARQSRGELANEFGEVLAQTRAGVPLIEALEEFSTRLNIPAVTRFVDGISVAVNRGTPLADVLRAQAQDVRDVAKRELMESAGRKEIAMMVPLVFGVLPLTVIFAVFPGLALLQIGL